MDVRGSLTGTATFLVVSCGVAVSAHALTFDEFDRLPGHHQENFIFTVLNFYHYQFARNDNAIGIANCMVDLDQRTDASGVPHLYSAVVRSLDVARGTTDNGVTIEGVIRDVVNHECPPR